VHVPLVVVHVVVLAKPLARATRSHLLSCAQPLASSSGHGRRGPMRRVAWACGAPPLGVQVAQARLNHAVAHRIWPAATWRAVGMAMSAILAMADAQVDTGDKAGERDRARSPSRSHHRSHPPHSSSSEPEAPGPSRPAPPAAAEADQPRPRPMESGRPSKGGGRGGRHSTAPTRARRGGRRHRSDDDLQALARAILRRG